MSHRRSTRVNGYAANNISEAQVYVRHSLELVAILSRSRRVYLRPVFFSREKLGSRWQALLVTGEITVNNSLDEKLYFSSWLPVFYLARMDVVEFLIKHFGFRK